VFGSKRTDLDRLREELGNLDLDLGAFDARAREQARRREPGAAFGTEKVIDDAVRKIAEKRAALVARRALVEPAVRALERLESARAALPGVLAAAALPQDVTEARAALDGALAEAVVAELAARRLHEHAKAQAGQAESATRHPMPGHDSTRAGRLRSLADARYGLALAAYHAVEGLSAAAHALEELAMLEREAAQALATLDAKPRAAA
jgi:hypothetical protein